MNVLQFGQNRSASSRAVTYSGASEPIQLGKSASPKWLPTVNAQVEKLSRLGYGWNNADAKPIDTETLRHSVGLLYYVWPFDGPAPFVAPTCYGGVQFEWRHDGLDLEVEVVRPHQVRVLISDEKNESESFFECKHDLTELLKAVDVFKLRHEARLNATAAA